MQLQHHPPHEDGGPIVGVAFDIGALASIAALAALAVLAVAAYAWLALVAQRRLAARPPLGTLAEAIAVGAIVPACACTALAYARRSPEALRAPFLLAAYAANPLLLLAAAILAGPIAAVLVLFAAGVAAAVSTLIPPPTASRRLRLDDLLLKRAASGFDALPYARRYAAPSVALGALVALTVMMGQSVLAGLLVAGLALLFAAPPAEVAEDHGSPFSRRLFILQAAFAVVSGLVVGGLA